VEADEREQAAVPAPKFSPWLPGLSVVSFAPIWDLALLFFDSSLGLHIYG
jgi:hypothetical protein